MSKKTFAIPSKKNKKNPAGKGGYPMPDIKHARNALARVAQYGTPAEQARVKAMAYRMFPSLKKSKKKKSR